MNVSFGRFARALLLTGGIAIAVALPSFVGTPLMPSNADPGARIAMAAPAQDNDNNDDPTNDNSDERNIEGSVIELDDKESPPRALVGMVGGDVWARLYNDQLQRSGVSVGDYVHMQGEYGEHGIFDAYQVDVLDRGGDDNDNDDD
jgi:hypothetical protein